MAILQKLRAAPGPSLAALLLIGSLAGPAAAQGEEDAADAPSAEADAIPKTGADGRNPLVDRLSEHLGAGLAGPVPDGFDPLSAVAPAAPATPAEGDAPADGAEPAAEAASDDGAAPAEAAAPVGMTIVAAMIETHGLLPKAPPTTDDRGRGRQAPTKVVPPPPAGVPSPVPARLVAEVPDGGPRLLLVDAGAIFFTPDGMAWVAVPNQQIAVPPPKSVAVVDLLPLRPEQAVPRPGTPLTAAMTADPALLAVLRTVQRIEAEDVDRLRRYLKRDGAGGFTVKTFVRNEDVRVAGWMQWTEGPGGRPVGKLPPDAVRMAIFAVTAGYTIQDIADWLRTMRRMDLEPAIEAARLLARQSEFILERAGLDHRVLSPRHAEFKYNQGVSAFEEGDLERAEKHFRSAIEARSEMLDAHYNLGVTLYRAGRYKQASSAFLIASGIEGAPARIFYNRGATLFRLGDALGAARQFRKALAAGYTDREMVEAWIAKTDPEGKTAPPPPEEKKKRRRRKRR